MPVYDICKMHRDGVVRDLCGYGMKTKLHKAPDCRQGIAGDGMSCPAKRG